MGLQYNYKGFGLLLVITQQGMLGFTHQGDLQFFGFLEFMGDFGSTQTIYSVCQTTEVCV